MVEIGMRGISLGLFVCVCVCVCVFRQPLHCYGAWLCRMPVK
jgi:hypothetical protein